MNKFLFTATLFTCSLAAHAQKPALTAKDYEHAESFLNYNTEPLIDHGSVHPNWLPGDKFWYRDLNANGSEFILVDPAKKTLSAAFDQQKLAAGLSTASGKQYKAAMLPFKYFSFLPDSRDIIFITDGKQWKCDLLSYQCIVDT